MGAHRRFRHEARRFLFFLLWPLLAAVTIAVLLQVPPPFAPDCPSLMDAARDHGRSMGPRFYDCRTVGGQTDATIQWAFISVILGPGVLVGGYGVAAHLRRKERSA